MTYASGSRIYRNLFIPASWAKLPNSHIASRNALDPREYVSFCDLYSGYNVTNHEVRTALIKLAWEGKQFKVAGFHWKAVRGHGVSYYVSRNIVDSLMDAIAEKGHRAQQRGNRGVRVVRTVLQGKIAKQRPVEVVRQIANESVGDTARVGEMERDELKRLIDSATQACVDKYFSDPTYMRNRISEAISHAFASRS